MDALSKNTPKKGGNIMKNGKWMAVIGSGLLAGLFAASGAVMARDGGNEVANGTITVKGYAESDYPTLATVTAEQAVQKALDAVPGNVLKTELEDENGFLVYGIEVVSPDRKVMEVKVDAGSGEVLAIGPDENDDVEAREKDEIDENGEIEAQNG